MKPINKFFALMAIALTAIVSVISCGEEDDKVNVSRSEIVFGIDGGEESFDVTSNTSWYISSKPSWVRLDRESGKGDKTVTVTVEKNNDITERSATMLIIAGDDEDRITIKQEGRAPVVTVNPTTLNFASKKDDAHSFSITSDKSWTMTECPDWLTPSATSGNSGSTSVMLTTTSANDTPNTRQGQVVISDGENSAILPVTQDAGRTSDCKTVPANILRMSDDICYNYKCGSNVKFFYDRLFVTASMKLRTEDEIVNSVTQDADSWSRTSSEDASQPTCYGPQLSPGTTYTLVTVSFDKDDKLGEIHKEEIRTKTSVNQPEVNATRLYFKGSGYNSYYGVEVEKGDNGYCSKYYVWAAAGELQTSWMFSDSPSVLAWYLKDEIARNSTSHATNINARTDALLASWGYTFNDGSPISSSGREYLEGPMSQELATFEKLRHGTDDESIQVIAWGMDVDGEFSGKVFSWLAELSDFNTKRAIAPQRAPQRTASDATSFKPRHLPATRGLNIKAPWQ